MGSSASRSFDKRLQNYHERATGFFHSGPAKVVVRPLTRNGITNRILAMAKQAGVKLSMHRLRKGFGCRVAKQLGKGNAPVLHELMRHRSMQITMDYYASVDDALQEVMGRLR
jgi:integrase